MVVLALLGAVHLPFVRARVFEWARTQAAQRLGIVVEADAGHTVTCRSVFYVATVGETVSAPHAFEKGTRKIAA